MLGGGATSIEVFPNPGIVLTCDCPASSLQFFDNFFVKRTVNFVVFATITSYERWGRHLY